MLQRKGRRVKAGLEEDALERSVSLYPSLWLSLSLSPRSQPSPLSLCSASARVLCTSGVHSARLCVLLCKQTFRIPLQTNTLINHSDSLERRGKEGEGEKTREHETEGKRQGP